MQRVGVLALALALAAVVAGAAAFDAEADGADEQQHVLDAGFDAATEADVHVGVHVPPRPGAKLVRATLFGSHTQTVNIVPKGDARAQGPTTPDDDRRPIAPVQAARVPSIAVANGRLSPLAPFNGQRGTVAALAEPPVAAPASQPAQHSGMGTAAMNRDVAGPGSQPSAPSSTAVPNDVPPPALAPAAARLVRRMGANYGDNACLRQGGQCQHTATCGGLVTRGLCPGPSFITCCTYTSTACAALNGACKDTSTCLGTVVRGLCPGGNNIACCTARVGTNGDLLSAATAAVVPAAAPSSQGGNCLANFNGKALADRAVQYQQTYRNHGVRWTDRLPHFGLPPTVKQADSASFVTSVLDSLSWNCLFAAGRHIDAMIPHMRVRGGFHADARVGDIAMWERSAGIVTALCAANTVRLVTMNERVGAQDTGCEPDIHTWGQGKFLGFWTPW